MSTKIDSQKWQRSIFGIQDKDWRMIIFPSPEDFRKSLPLFRKDGELGGVPYCFGPLYVPVTLLPLIDSILKENGIRFHLLNPINEADVTPEQRKATKQRKALLHKKGEVFFFRKADLYDLYRNKGLTHEKTKKP